MLPASLQSPKQSAMNSQMNTNVYWGYVIAVNPENQTMSVQTYSEGAIIPDISINNSISELGIGIRFMPIPLSTRVILYQQGATWYHIGYFLSNQDNKKEIGLKNTTDTKNNDKQSIFLLQRYLEPGEVQLVGIAQSEVLLATDGSVLIRDSNGSYLKLNAQENTAELSTANICFDLDEVRIRSGNIIRPTVTDTHENEHIVLYNDEVTKESSLPEGVTGDLLKEFIVEVGTSVNPETGVDYPDSLTSPSPSVGLIGMGDKIVDSKGAELASANKSLNFLVKTASGGGIAIDEDGGVVFIDQLGGTVTKFSSGAEGEKSLRIGNNYVTITANGIFINHTSGSTLNIDSTGIIDITYKSGRNIVLDDNGCSLNFPDTGTTVLASNIKLISTENTTLGVNGTDSILAGVRTSTWFDTIFLPAFATWLDTHITPVGPIAPPFLTTIAPFVAASGMSLQTATGLIQAPRVAVD